MSFIAAVGQSFALNGREACVQAVEQARLRISRESKNIALAFIFSSMGHSLADIMRGVSAQLREVPLLGFNTIGQLTSQGQQRRSVVVALVAGKGIKVQADWWPDFTKNSKVTTMKMVDTFQPTTLTSDEPNQTLLLVADGIQGNGMALCNNLPKGSYMLGGCLTGSNERQSQTVQFGGKQAGEGGLAAALIYGRIKTGIGVRHGWHPIGEYFQLTHVEEPWIRTLDNVPASEKYAQLFGQHSREWVFPPLNELVRLYPLGLEQNGESSLLIRSPLQVEVDGSFRMNSPAPEGSTGHLMVGSTATCVEAAREACREALKGIGTARPGLAVVFADVAWKMLFETQSGRDIAAIREVLGPDVPIAGGYTVGQIASKAPNTPKLLNQHIEIIIFGSVDG